MSLQILESENKNIVNTIIKDKSDNRLKLKELKNKKKNGVKNNVLLFEDCKTEIINSNNKTKRFNQIIEMISFALAREILFCSSNIESVTAADDADV